MDYIKVFLVALPPRIYGATIYTFDEDDYYYTIFINKDISNEMQIKAYDHEMEHINAEDFESMYPADQLEAIRHAV